MLLINLIAAIIFVCVGVYFTFSQIREENNLPQYGALAFAAALIFGVSAFFALPSVVWLIVWALVIMTAAWLIFAKMNYHNEMGLTSIVGVFVFLALLAGVVMPFSFTSSIDQTTTTGEVTTIVDNQLRTLDAVVEDDMDEETGLVNPGESVTDTPDMVTMTTFDGKPITSWSDLQSTIEDSLASDDVAIKSRAEGFIDSLGLAGMSRADIKKWAALEQSGDLKEARIIRAYNTTATDDAIRASAAKTVGAETADKLDIVRVNGTKITTRGPNTDNPSVHPHAVGGENLSYVRVVMTEPTKVKKDSYTPSTEKFQAIDVDCVNVDIKIVKDTPTIIKKVKTPNKRVIIVEESPKPTPTPSEEPTPSPKPVIVEVCDQNTGRIIKVEESESHDYKSVDDKACKPTPSESPTPTPTPTPSEKVVEVCLDRETGEIGEVPESKKDNYLPVEDCTKPEPCKWNPDLQKDSPDCTKSKDPKDYVKQPTEKPHASAPVEAPESEAPVETNPAPAPEPEAKPTQSSKPQDPIESDKPAPSSSPDPIRTEEPLPDPVEQAPDVDDPEEEFIDPDAAFLFGMPLLSLVGLSGGAYGRRKNVMEREKNRAKPRH